MLTDAGLLAEKTRLRQSGKHTSEYSRNVGEVSVAITADGDLEATVSRRVQSDGPKQLLFGRAQ
ncbi:hypothetical protein G9466_21245 [Halorussus sp. JP-T4]|nr:MULTISPECIES: hypothetical protein [Halorussus]NHN61588.1 hypothetical protein [Halorussus sp. JP-T4]